MKKKIEEKLSNRVLRELISLLRDGYFDDSETLPREDDLAQVLQVSRTSLRDVLKILEQEGYIIRVKKKGTVINRRVLDIKFRIDIEYEFKQMLELAHYQHSAEILSIEKIPANSLHADKLEASIGDMLYKVCKLVSADSSPVIYCEDFILESNFKEPVKNKDIFRMPIYDVLENFCDERIDFNVTKLVPMIADDLIKEKLTYEGAMLMVEEVGFTRKLKPVLFSDIYWRGDFFDFEIVRKRY